MCVTINALAAQVPPTAVELFDHTATGPLRRLILQIPMSDVIL